MSVPRTRLLFALFVLTGGTVSYWLLSLRGRGWVTLFAALAAFALTILQIVLERIRADEIEGKDPYSQPPSITR